MRILFTNTNSYLPQWMGGSEVSTHDLALTLAQRGHRPAVLAALKPAGPTWIKNRLLKQLTGKAFPADTRHPYPIFRGYGLDEESASAVAEVVAAFHPDAAIIQVGSPALLANALIDAGIPTVVYFRDAEFLSRGGMFPHHSLLGFAANSSFTAALAKEKLGVDADIIQPLVRASAYTTTRVPNYALFINPVTVKGLDTAVELARRNPDIPFVFQESWPLGNKTFADLETRCKALPNIALHHATIDMKSVYRGARLLLAPSRWLEAWGRVVTEAHFSGIPVIASRIGGLPESVGPGGLLIPPDAPDDAWNEALNNIWHNPEEYAALSNQALLYSQRDEIRPDTLASRLLAAIDRLISNNNHINNHISAS